MENEKKYDIFISFKCTDNLGSPTPDSQIGVDLYNEFTAHGYKVFFSNETLRKESVDQYMLAISNAIEQAHTFILVATKPEYPRSSWVKKEWTSFLNRKLSSESDIRFFNVLSGFSAKELPALISDFQSFKNEDGAKSIIDFILDNKEHKEYNLVDFIHAYYEQKIKGVDELVKIYHAIVEKNDSDFYRRSLDYMLGIALIRESKQEGIKYLENAYKLGSIRAAYALFEITNDFDYKRKGYAYYQDRFLNKINEKKDLLIVCDNSNKMLDLVLKSMISLYYHVNLYNYGVSFADYESDTLKTIDSFSLILLAFSSLARMKLFIRNESFEWLVNNKKRVNVIVSGIKPHEIPKEYRVFIPYIDAENRHSIYRLSNKIVEDVGNGKGE